jgi:hypothetical protein
MEVDYDRIRTKFNELRSNILSQMAIDPWNVKQLAAQLDGEGFEIIAFGQGYASMSASTKKLAEVVLVGKLNWRSSSFVGWPATCQLSRTPLIRETVEEELRANRWYDRKLPADYDDWRKHFGSTGGFAATAGHPVHEPVTSRLLVVLLAAYPRKRVRKHAVIAPSRIYVRPPSRPDVGASVLA